MAPLVYIQYPTIPSEYLSGGTQYVEGPLSFAQTTTIVLSDAIFGRTGSYVLFDYNNGTFIGGQSELDNNVQVIDSDLKLSAFYTLTNMPLEKQIILELRSKPTNGTQYVDGPLVIDGPLSIMLSATLFATAQTYVLFDWTGSGSFPTPSQVNNITCYPLQAGRFVSVPPYVDGTTIKVQLA